MLIDVMKNHGLEQLVPFPTREKLNSHFFSCQFQEIHSPDKHSNHYVISGTFKTKESTLNLILTFLLSYRQPYTHTRTHLKTPRKVLLYQTGNFESMRKDASDFVKDRLCNGY